MERETERERKAMRVEKGGGNNRGNQREGEDINYFTS